MTMEPSETRVLVVDDSPLDRKLLTLHLGRAGYDPKLACDGLEAWELLTSAPDLVDVVLLDRSMPRLSGIELLERMKAHPRLRMVPVILQTAAVAREELLEGIRAGAVYYLTKPYDPGLLLEVVRTAANDYEDTRSILNQLQQGIQTFSLLDRASFSIRTIEDARAVGAMLANLCPDPFSAVIGLTELLLNCVEHGNLGITYDEKSALKTREEWSAEVERRLRLPENQSKRVRVLFERDESVARFTFRDEGNGFDASKFMEIDPQRAFDTHGRGIAMARRLSFDSIDYLGCGNEVVATIRRPSAKKTSPPAVDTITTPSSRNVSSPGQGQS